MHFFAREILAAEHRRDLLRQADAGRRRLALRRELRRAAAAGRRVVLALVPAPRDGRTREQLPTSPADSATGRG